MKSLETITLHTPIRMLRRDGTGSLRDISWKWMPTSKISPKAIVGGVWAALSHLVNKPPEASSHKMPDPQLWAWAGWATADNESGSSFSCGRQGALR